MYTGTHQRTGSNPRTYGAQDITSLNGRRDDGASQSMYSGSGDDGYNAYSHAGYGGMSSVGGYAGYSSGMSLGGYPATSSSPSAPSGSRRTSGPKLATPPQASTTTANPSPSSRYYPSAQAQPADQSPYQPSSAPPQVSSHHHSSLSGQPQTAHPYPGQYQHYYDQQGHQNSSQWASYPSASAHSYASQSAAPRNNASQATTTPTMPQSATVGDTHHRSSASSGLYDYPTASSGYQSWPTHEQSRSTSGQQQAWQQQASASSRQSQTQSAQPAPMPQGAWQGYGNHPSMSHTMPPQHMANPQYGWQPQWNGQQYGYPPAPVHTQSGHQAGQALPATSSAAPLYPKEKKPKKEKKEKPPKAEKPPKEPKAPKPPKRAKHEIPEGYAGLGKRLMESSTEEEVEVKKDGRGRKKGKKDEKEKEKVPKAHPKSHLHPPRQAQSAWQLFFTDELNKAKAAASQGNSPGGTPHHAKLNVAQIAKDAGIAYATLGEDQKKYYAQKVQESKEQYIIELAAWQATLTPEDIKAENAFRAQQRKEGKSRKGNLKDPNAPKKPLSAYFLFLKGIRENDDIRAKVWGEESETTKQSVLAAEKWRSLSDDEKKPYLQQAENDKQEYEAARKIYEDEAAARARGEDVPRRPPAIPESSTHPAPAPTSLLRDDVKAYNPADHTSSDPVKPSSPAGEGVPSSDNNFAGFESNPDHPGSSDHTPAHGSGDFELDDFKGFTDPLQDMDLAGLEGITTNTADNNEPQWDELQKLMGTTDDGYDNSSAEDKPAAAEIQGETSDVAGVSIAPSLEEAQASNDAQNVGALQSEAQVQDLATQAEGVSVVPQTLPQTNQEGSGVPTEEVNELPPAGVPIADDADVPTEVPTALIGQENAQPTTDVLGSGPVVDGV
ncbi:uncharacterized protein I206_101135 [Kwoniella pini CBS 10737]|uniref:HMG box domain-containing protein n=1 Tax=Kwoniella pini CBS 10737 TaxID=1296096 RepID=A0A1B9IBW5_9TREE|nr:uncharacterized protein I206_00191 [Kwoniella pini CBS 10737]OCF52890.1 hypothetical protein I206_00191 [Kwoniella pini CBS 10737]